MGNECITKTILRQAIRLFDKTLKPYRGMWDAHVRKGITLMDKEDLYETQICFNQPTEIPHSF